MTFSAVGAIVSAASPTTLSLTPAAVGNFFLLEVNNSSNATVSCTGLSSTNATWTPLVASFAGTNNAQTARVFLGIVTSASTASVTASWSGTTPAAGNIAGHEFSSTAGANLVVLDKQGHLDLATGTNTWASLTPVQAGELYFGWCGDSGTAGSISTAGYSSGNDSNGNGVGWNPSCTSAAQAPVWTDSGHVFGIMVLVREAAAVKAGRATRANLITRSQSQLTYQPGLIYSRVS